VLRVALPVGFWSDRNRKECDDVAFSPGGLGHAQGGTLSMTIFTSPILVAVRLTIAVGLISFVPVGNSPAQANPCNPCAPAANPCNPCGGNPCAPAANPCNPCGGNPCNPLGQIESSRFKQPAGSELSAAKSAALVAEGEALWKSREVSNGAAACADCHRNDYTMINPTFAEPYPHSVQMVQLRSAEKEVNAAEMVNFCIVTAMNSEPLAWDSEQLAALTAYVENIRPGYVPRGGIAGANPCNPCGANPCNPCGGR